MRYVVANIMAQSQDILDVPVILEGQTAPVNSSYIELRITPVTYDTQPGHHMTSYTIDAAIAYKMDSANIYGFDNLLEEAKKLFKTIFCIKDFSQISKPVVGYLYLSSPVKTIPYGKLQQQTTYMLATMMASYIMKEDKNEDD